jgi:pimeloyl-ACP methyl ester carboxylesterase
MLALAHAAAHPADVACLVLVGCGTFDAPARDLMHRTLDARTDAALRERLARLPEQFPDPDARRLAQHVATLPLYACDLLTTDTEAEGVDARAHRETWDDMMRLQCEGVYPAAFAAVRAPVLMVHGSVDPHPGRMIHESLERYIARIEYVELERCGHYPWLERSARDLFLSLLHEWLARHCGADEGSTVH